MTGAFTTAAKVLSSEAAKSVGMAVFAPKRRQLTSVMLLSLTLALTACPDRAGSAPAGSSGSQTAASPASPSSDGFVPFVAEGFRVSKWADVPNARSLAMSPDGKLLFVGTREGQVHKVTIEGQKASKVEVFQDGLNGSNGVAFLGDDLYVAELLRVVRYSKSKGFAKGIQGEVVLENLPPEKHHGWRYLKAGPDGRLYISIGAPCNVCERTDDERFASVCSFLPDGTDFRVEAHGVRNSVGYDWHPTSGDLYFTDNGRDMMGDDIPPCELNRLAKKETGTHFGFPYFWGDNQPDPEYGSKAPKRDYRLPLVKFQAHVAPLGCHFPRNPLWQGILEGKLLVAQHGSWNRSSPVGYQVVTVDLKDPSYPVKPFLWGFLGEENGNHPVHGRPVDVCELADGTILVSDDGKGRIWAVTKDPGS